MSQRLVQKSLPPPTPPPMMLLSQYTRRPYHRMSTIQHRASSPGERFLAYFKPLTPFCRRPRPCRISAIGYRMPGIGEYFLMPSKVYENPSAIGQGRIRYVFCHLLKECCKKKICHRGLRPHLVKTENVFSHLTKDVGNPP